MGTESIIAASTTIRGHVSADGDLALLGRVEGSVTVQGTLEVGEAAELRSNLRGRHVVVRGAVAGNVVADESIVLEAGARVVGDLAAPTIALRPGALVRGHVQTGSAATGERRAAEPARRAEQKEPRPVATAASVRAPVARAAAAPSAAEPPVTVTRPAAPVTAARSSGAGAEPKRPPPPVVPKASGRAQRRAEPEREPVRSAPAPVVPVPARRGAKASRRSGSH